MWRIWVFVAGTPVGLLAALALSVPPGATGVLGAAVIGAAVLGAAGLAGLALLAVASTLARASSWHAERGRHLARASSAGLLALPAAASAWFALPPGAGWLTLAILLVLGAAIFRATRLQVPADGIPRHAARLMGALVVASLALVVLAGVISVLRPGLPADTVALARAVWDIDAGILMGEDPGCVDRVRRATPLVDLGAHPRLSPDGTEIWFDARTSNGARQIHRLRRASGELRCWTCDEPGNNRRPSPEPSGIAVLFDTDRHRSLQAPLNTEIHVASASGSGAARSRRLTYDPGPDDHAIYDPSGRGIVWSRASDAGFAVVRAAIQSGHGGLLLGSITELAPGGSRWVLPLSWSQDARAFATGRGKGWRHLDASVVDFATAEEVTLGTVLAGPGSVSFSADGSRWVVATTRPSGAASLIPAQLGFLLGRLRALAVLDDANGAAGSGIGLGTRGHELRDLDLGPIAEWGVPTGVSLSPAGDAFVLSQRRREGGDIEERLLWIELDCAATGS